MTNPNNPTDRAAGDDVRERIARWFYDREPLLTWRTVKGKTTNHALPWEEADADSRSPYFEDADAILALTQQTPPAPSKEGWTERGKEWLAAGAPLGEDYRIWDAPAPSEAIPAGVPVAWVSPHQFADHADPSNSEDFGGAYLPVRKSQRGNFTMPLYASPPSAPMVDNDLIGRLRETLEELCGVIDSARDQVPDDEEGLAAELFAHYLNAAQMKARKAALDMLAQSQPGGEDIAIGEFIARYDDAAEGICMDADDAQALSRELKRLREIEASITSGFVTCISHGNGEGGSVNVKWPDLASAQRAHSLLVGGTTQSQPSEPVAWVSPGQFANIGPDPSEAGGAGYLPIRHTSAGNFTMPLYATPPQSQPVYPSLELCVQFSDDGQHIRKWSRLPFDGGTNLYSHPPQSQPNADQAGGNAEREDG